MTYKIQYDLPGLPKGLNGSHGHHYAAAAIRKKWRKMSASGALGVGVPKEPLARCRIVCTRFSSSEMDYDNLVSSFKPIVDGLKDAGVILDDKSSVIVERSYRWEKVPAKSGHVRIAVEAMELESNLRPLAGSLMDENKKNDTRQGSDEDFAPKPF